MSGFYCQLSLTYDQVKLGVYLILSNQGLYLHLTGRLLRPLWSGDHTRGHGEEAGHDRVPVT